MIYFLDTNICIYFLKGMYPGILKEIQKRSPNTIKIASMVKAELYYGVEKSIKKEENFIKLKEFLQPFEIIHFNGEGAEIYGKIRRDLEIKGNIIGPNDMIIAATVLQIPGILVTNNVNEFSNIPNLVIENWIEEEKNLSRLHNSN